MSEKSPSGRLALLDRGGTIMVDKAYLRDPDGIEFTPGAIEDLRLLRNAGSSLVLMTNQSGIARGVVDVAMLVQIHGRLQSMLAAEGVRLEGIYYCPHGPDQPCDCRKPTQGMVRNAIRDLGFGPAKAVLIGDSDANIEAAAAACVRAVRLARKGNSRVEGRAAGSLEAVRRACAILAVGSGGDAACT
jgi:D-glycero-D-manno-heptose 1,7-bisphosphate phosphatase